MSESYWGRITQVFAKVSCSNLNFIFSIEASSANSRGHLAFPCMNRHRHLVRNSRHGLSTRSFERATTRSLIVRRLCIETKVELRSILCSQRGARRFSSKSNLRPPLIWARSKSLRGSQTHLPKKMIVIMKLSFCREIHIMRPSMESRVFRIRSFWPRYEKGLTLERDVFARDGPFS